MAQVLSVGARCSLKNCFRCHFLWLRAFLWEQRNCSVHPVQRHVCDNCNNNSTNNNKNIKNIIIIIITTTIIIIIMTIVMMMIKQ